MSRTNLMKNTLAQAYAGLATRVSLHSDDPGITGANEIAGLGHKTITWPSAPTAGVIVSSAVSFDLVAATNLTHVGIWDSSGQFLDSFVNFITFAADTTYNLSIEYDQDPGA